MNEFEQLIDRETAAIREAVESANPKGHRFLLLLCAKSGEIGPCDKLKVFGCSNATPEINQSMIQTFLDSTKPKDNQPSQD